MVAPNRGCSRLLFAALALPLLACGASSNAGEGDAGTGHDGSADAATPPPGESYTLTFGPIQVPPSTRTRSASSPASATRAPIHVGAIHNVLGDVVAPHDRLPRQRHDGADDAVRLPALHRHARSGQGLAAHDRRRRRTTCSRCPPGVAYTLDANQMIRLEMHYINADGQRRRRSSRRRR